MKRAGVRLAAVLVCGAVVARAQDTAPPPAPETVATRAAELVRDKNADELAALAAKDKPDPWDVADVLCDRGAFDVADAFARAAPRVAVEALPGYVASARQFPKAGDGRKRLAEATSLLDSGHADEALAKLDDASAPAAAELPIVPALRLRRVRGLALDKLTRHADALVALQSAAADAETAGWLTFAVRCRIDAAQSMQAAKELEATLAEWARIVTLRERLGDRAGVGRALSNVGSFAKLRGDYRGAMVFYERAAAVFEGLGDKPEYRATAGEVLTNRGLVATSLGRYADAFESFERARDLQKSAGNRSDLARTLTQMGRLHHAMGALDEAAECETQALGVAEEAGDDAEAAAAGGSLGCTLNDLGRLDAAREALERAREIYRKRNETVDAAVADMELASVARRAGRLDDAATLASAAEQATATWRDRRVAARAWKEIGACRLAASDPAGALAAFRRATEESESVGNADLSRYAARGEAASLVALGRFRDAAASALRALDLTRQVGGGLSGFRLTDLRASVGSDYDEVELGTRAAASLGDVDALCIFLEHGRAADVLASIARTGAEHLRGAIVGAELLTREATLREDEAAAEQRLADAQASGDLVAIRSGRRTVEDARAAVARIVQRIHVESRPAAAILYPEPADLARIRGTLLPGEGLASFATAGGEALALVVTASSARVAQLGPAAALRDACTAFDGSRPGGVSAETVAAMRKRIVEPLALEEGVKRLLVVPDGPLATVPFALLAPDLEVAYVPSATTYMLLSARRKVRGDGVLAFGDPEVGGAGTRLPAARDEARSVGDRVRLGPDASEAALRRDLDDSSSATPPVRRRAVHFACHGFVDTAKPWESALLLAAGGGHDGRLTAMDVAELRFDVDLAVLSACETARGGAVRGDGVVGLPRAFLAAGAPRVLVSLWKVDDAATAALMKRFYELWRDGRLGAAAALREAQCYVRAQKGWEEPTYWAAWQLWGLAE